MNRRGKRVRGDNGEAIHQSVLHSGRFVREKKSRTHLTAINSRLRHLQQLNLGKDLLLGYAAQGPEGGGSSLSSSSICYPELLFMGPCGGVVLSYLETLWILQIYVVHPKTLDYLVYRPLINIVNCIVCISNF